MIRVHEIREVRLYWLGNACSALGVAVYGYAKRKWRNKPLLRPVENGGAGEDGLTHFDLIIDEIDGTKSQKSEPLFSFLVLDDISEGFEGVCVHCESNSMIALLDEVTERMEV